MKTFEELGVCQEIRRAIEEMGFVQPMPVQEAVIPSLLESRQDTIALAQTGTGKTAAFGIPLLQRLTTLCPSEGGKKEAEGRKEVEPFFSPSGGQREDNDLITISIESSTIHSTTHIWAD